MNKPVLLIGIGQFGCTVTGCIENSLGGKNSSVHIVAIDTDERVQKAQNSQNVISMAHSCNISEILDNLDNELLKSWFPCDRDNDCVEYFESLGMNEGANQWRMKALLAFYYYLSNEKKVKNFERIIGDTVQKASEKISSVDVYIIASLSGGTGSGLFIPVSLYIKRLLHRLGVEKVNCSAVLALPEVVEELLTGEQKIKARANAYASLCELNAMNKIAAGEKTDAQIKLGSEDDPFFGLLYDSESEEPSDKPKPFNKVYLYNRPYGMYSVQNLADLLSNAVTALIKEEPVSQLLQENDAIYGGIIVSDTIYPSDSIVSYISARTLYETAETQWLYLYKKAAKKLKAMRIRAYSRGKNFTENGSTVTEAVLQAANDIYRENDLDPFCLFSPLLSRSYKNSADDSSPDETVPTDYFDMLVATAQSEFENDFSAGLSQLIEPQPKKSGESRFPLKRIADQRSDSKKLALTAAELFRDYFELCCHITTEYREEFLENVISDGSEISIKSGLLQKSDGRPVNPVYALVCLCQVYSMLKDISDNHRSKFPKYDPEDFTFERENGQDASENKNESKKSSPIDLIPEWMFLIEDNTEHRCRYSKQGEERLLTALRGNTKHIGIQREDGKTLLGDIKTAFERMKDTFLALRAETAMEVIGQLISGYYAMLHSLFEELDEIETECNFALNKGTAETRFTFYAGAGQKEKKYLFSRYFDRIKHTKEGYALENRLDTAFGELASELVYDFVKCAKDKKFSKEEKLLSADGLLEFFGSIIADELKASEFYKEFIDRDVLCVLLEQNKRQSGMTSDLAVRKALLTNGFTVKYTIPEESAGKSDGYHLLRMLQNRVIAVLPTESMHYLSSIADQYNGKEPTRIMDELFSMAGESYGTVDFRTNIPKNRMYVFRETMGLKLSFIEKMNEKSEDPAYYKGYKASLKISREQSTELWNPHLICSLKEDSLPKIFQE